MDKHKPMTLDILCKRLGLNAIHRILDELIPTAEREQWSYTAFLERLLSEEIAQRTEGRIANLIARAKFPFHATIETFDFTFRSDLKRQMLGRFLGPELVSEHRCLILEGPPGTGKTHLCIAIAYKAIQNGFIARFATAATLINELRIAPDRNAALKPYLQPHVLVIDEMGYLGYGAGAADVLFQLVDHRYHQGKPTLFTTNKPLAQWGRVLHDEELARAIIDRTLHHGDYLKLSGPSYRLKGRKLDLDLPDAAPTTKAKKTDSTDKSLDNSQPTIA
ncbi:transposase-associated IstB-like ATP-binding protein (plasmid) [Leptolyngbya boryana NIES-2135]|jgi:DNA replication protein DnaC|uniref:Transposase-associated IstB-like ATP-binding protein n=2 Tax=Leptolyngbya group TaxID=3081713 RepID=A0A1Z4JSC5_LEPBY|nr:transposase-associated IstB-like ATP-binding protein [Leptolyngbya boryana IAM M-101]BAS61087.1 transposase-associated IstB-like ATP-binding protein [Leptolyngbya boryana dg5]BAY59129.1 transposase-associated IstB-like ATP-binding protein [Leptolyngbya boryana NIES-2135]BAY59586.1 transposase-associated IstB-like ATP-binding protein [Leptolyngbya boryana NIES-2135]